MKTEFDDALNGIYGEHDAEDVDAAAGYQALGPLSVACFVCGVAALLTFVHWVFGIFPIIGAIVGYLAIRKILIAPKVTTGASLTAAGLIMAILFSITGYGWQIYSYYAHAPEGYIEVEWTDLLSNGKARQFTFDMEAKSVITTPSGEMKIPGPGFHEVSGLAWSGRGRVSRVEVSTDNGVNWRLAKLQEPVLPVCHTRFRFPWDWDGKPAMLVSRCTDETGYTQPTIAQLIVARGMGGGPLGSFYHMNGIQSWDVAADGSVTNGNHSL